MLGETLLAEQCGAVEAALRDGVPVADATLDELQQALHVRLEEYRQALEAQP